MYYTNYFNGIDISSISAVCDQCISSLRKAGQTTVSFNGIVEPNMADKLDTSLVDAKSQIDKLISVLDSIKEALKVAQEIVTKQNSMKNETAETAIASAAEVQTKLKSFCSKIDEIDSNFDYLVSSITSLTSSEFKANVASLDDIKTKIDSYSNNLVTGYDTLEGIKNTVSSDAYLYKAWTLIASRYDFIMKKRDNFVNLLTNYINNVKVLEAKLPTTTAITEFDDTKTAVYAKTRDLKSDTSYDTYSKSGRGEEIKIPSTDPTNSSSSSGTTYTVNPDGTVTYKDENGNVTGKTVKDVNEITGWDYYKIAQYKAQGLTNEEIIAKYNKEQIAKASAARQAEYQRNYTAAQHRAEAAAHGYENSNYGYAQYKANQDAQKRQAEKAAAAQRQEQAAQETKQANWNYRQAQYKASGASNYTIAQKKASYFSK